MVKVAGFGNPLLDITVKLDNNYLLNKYNLREDDQYEINSDKMKCLLKDISKFNISYSPGGSVQNTLRTLQWLLNVPNSTFMFGVIGNDEQGKNLQHLVENFGVQTRYVVHKEEPTGIVVALTKGHNRSLVAYLGAAEKISENNSDVTSEIERLLNHVDYAYMEGFFITKRKTVAKHIQSFCEKNNKMFIVNLSAPYVIQENSETIIYLASKCDILFGNKKEFNTLKEAMQFEGSPQELILHLLNTYTKNKHNKWGKIIVITNSSKWVLCAHSNNVIEKLEVPKISSSKIVDTTGAGDAFSAGFLAGLIIEKSPKDCLKIALWAAAQIIQQIGCSLPQFSVNIENVLCNTTETK